MINKRFVQKLVGLSLSLMLMLSLFPATVAAESETWDGTIADSFGGGYGTESNPYQISSGAELAYLAQEVNGGNDFKDVYFELMDDIGLNNKQWTPIGKYTSSKQYGFNGSFNGGGYTVSGLTIGEENKSSDLEYTGLFGQIGAGGTVKNLSVKGKVYGNNYCGVLAGNNEGVIENCHTEGLVASGSHNGGLAGNNNGYHGYGRLINSSSSAEVFGSWSTGGLVADNTGSIGNSFATGNVENTGEVKAGYIPRAGGLVGWNTASIINCYATGDVTGEDGSYVGGLVGWNRKYDNDTGTIQGSYYDKTAEKSIGQDDSNQGDDVMGYDLSAMQSQAFTNILNSNIVSENLETMGYFWIWPGEGETPILEPVHDGIGRGTEDDPYIIRTENRLRLLAKLVNEGIDFEGKYFKLGCDIDLNGQWTPIGRYDVYENAAYAFEGCFNGGEHSISNLAVGTSEQAESYKDNGLFGYVGERGTIKNLTVSGRIYSGENSVSGIIAARLYGGSISYCFANGDVTGNFAIKGGLVGKNKNGSITNSAATGNVSGNDYSYNGGLVGENTGTITNSYSTGSILNNDKSTNGCLVGLNANSGVIINCYAAGSVSASIQSTNGSLVGEDKGGSFTSCYFNSEAGIKGVGNKEAGVDGITGKSLEDMKTQTFVDTLNAYVRSYRTVTVNGSSIPLSGWTWAAGTNGGLPTLTMSTPAVNDGGSSGSSSGGRRPAPAPLSPTTGNGVPVSYSQNGSTATVDLPVDKLDEIIEKSKEGEVLLDLSGATDVSSAELPKATLDTMAQAGLDFGLILPLGTLILDEEATASVANQAGGDKLEISLGIADVTSLNPTQQDQVKEGQMILDISIKSGDENISTFDGSITIRIPYTGSLPAAVWYLNDAGQLEKLNCSYENGIVTFKLDHLSLYILGQDTEWDIPFTDVKEKDWFYDPVKFVYQKGIMKGLSEKLFGPGADTSRGMIVTILHRLASPPDLSAEQLAGNPFTDVAPDKYYGQAIIWAEENNIVAGYGNGKFGPDHAISREQMATILINYAKYQKMDTDAKVDLSVYSDNKEISAWAMDAMIWANAKELIQGSEGQLMPQGEATRAQAAAILNRFIEN